MESTKLKDGRRGEQLTEWLESHNCTAMWEQDCGNFILTLYSGMFGKGMATVIVQRWKKGSGFEIYAPAQSQKVTETFSEIENMLSPKTKAGQFSISVNREILADESEQIEDALASFCAGLELEGNIESAVTGNSTAIRFVEPMHYSTEKAAKAVLDAGGHLTVGGWCVEDVTGRAEERMLFITEEKAKELLDTVGRKFDATIGITWESIDCVLDDYASEELPAILEKQIDEMPDEISSVTVYGEWNEGMKDDIDGYLITIGDNHGKKDDEIFFHCTDKEDFKTLVSGKVGATNFTITKFEY